MTRLPIRQRTAALLLGALLVTPLVAAGESRSHGGSASPRAASLTSLDFLARLWSGLTSLWAEEGCSIDPDGGHCKPGQATPPGNGTPGSLTNARAQEGCSIDPNGGCAGKPGANSLFVPFGAGCSIDPSGGGCGGR
ncbi:MAG TPA: hypothetical protein VOA87_06430 [Thermoanaerobaculia bacterium]|nr:hypothetical protein [Thermoanaerobaculia bacterium]